LIADIANRWGFWHIGKLAADYRTQFGELPSATRQRPSLATSPDTA
jgi:AraC family ethanolamine operon transcriptional activator